MKALSIRQPWAHLILHHGKDVENRSWPTKHRGWLLLHAGAARPKFPTDVIDFLRDRGLTIEEIIRLGEAPRGGIVGIAELIDCVQDHDSVWAVPGEWHWVLRKPVERGFVPRKGRLGLFEVDEP